MFSVDKCTYVGRPQSSSLCLVIKDTYDGAQHRVTYSVPMYAHRYIILDFIFQVPNPALSSANPNRPLPGLPILGVTGASGSNPADLSIHLHTPFQDQDLKAWPMYCTGHNSPLAEYLSSTAISLL